MEKRIIYKKDDGGVCIIIPALESVALIGLDAIAQKDVPAGKPYKIVDAADIPDDRTFRAAWEVDQSALTDGAGAEYGVGTPWEVIGYGNGFVLVEHSETKEQKEVSL